MLVYKFSLDYVYILNIIDLPKRRPAGIDGWTILGPGIASAVAEVSWNGGTVPGDAAITLLSSTITLKKAKTKDIRCKYCNVTSNGPPIVTVDGAALTCTENDADWNNKQSYSNLEIFGSHLHLGDDMTDGPPPVFFCKNKADPSEPLSPPAQAFPITGGPGFCLTEDDSVYTEN